MLKRVFVRSCGCVRASLNVDVLCISISICFCLCISVFLREGEECAKDCSHIKRKLKVACVCLCAFVRVHVYTVHRHA